MTTSIRLTTVLSVAVGAMAAIAAALGVFARGDGTFTSATTVRGEIYELATSGVYAWSGRDLVAEGIGWDVFTLAVAAPALLVAAILIARGSYRGLLAAAGLLGYFAYMYLEYAVTWAFGPLFLLFVAILATSVVGLVAVAASLASAGIADRFTDRFPAPAWATLSIGMAVLLTLLWVARVMAALSATTPALEGETTLTVQALDLGLVVPVSVVTAVLALRRHPAGLVAAAAFSVMFTAMSAAITAMMLSSWAVKGVLELPPVVLFGAASVAAGILAVRMFRNVVADTPASNGFSTLIHARPSPEAKAHLR